MARQWCPGLNVWVSHGSLVTCLRMDSDWFKKKGIYRLGIVELTEGIENLGTRLWGGRARLLLRRQPQGLLDTSRRKSSQGKWAPKSLSPFVPWSRLQFQEKDLIGMAWVMCPRRTCHLADGLPSVGPSNMSKGGSAKRNLAQKRGNGWSDGLSSSRSIRPENYLFRSCRTSKYP